MTFEETLRDITNREYFEPLQGIPNSILYGFRNADKLLMAAELFKFFSKFLFSNSEIVSNDVLNGLHTDIISGHKIVVAPYSKFISPSMRTLIFNKGYAYILFALDNKPALQKNLTIGCPPLTEFASQFGLTENDWFVHNDGNLIICQHSVPAGDDVVNELHTNLKKFLQEN